jgi:hypothetical protein
MNKAVIGIVIAFFVAVSAIYQWAWYFDDDVNPDKTIPQYSRCESGLYVKKSPHPCNRGDLIYIDRDVAHKYCDANIIVEYDDAVYCQYNGYRDDLAELTRQEMEAFSKDDKKKP